MRGFAEFIKEQGIIGLAVGFILGGAVTKLVAAFVIDIINPLVGLLLGFTRGLDKASVKISSAQIAWGHFVSTLIDFIIIAFIIYITVRVLGITKFLKKK